SAPDSPSSAAAGSRPAAGSAPPWLGSPARRRLGRSAPWTPSAPTRRPVLRWWRWSPGGHSSGQSRGPFDSAPAAGGRSRSEPPLPPVQDHLEPLPAVPGPAGSAQLVVLPREDHQLGLDALPLQRRVVALGLAQRAAQVQLG